jgi:uncharacterized protein (DUF849 family)
MEAFLYRTMRLDKAEMSIHRQILCHRYIGVEPNSWQMKMSGFVHSVIYQMPPQTFTFRFGQLRTKPPGAAGARGAKELPSRSRRATGELIASFPAMLQACLNGGLQKTAHSAVPVSPDELARDAAAVRAAGANELHIHARTAEGAETLDPAAVADALLAIRAAVPGMPVGLGTGAWIPPSGRLRHEHIRSWSTKPDYASVNLNEPDALEVIDILFSQGVGVEAGLWDQKDARRFVEYVDFKKCLRVLIEMIHESPASAVAYARRILEMLRHCKCALPILLHGQGNTVWVCVELARSEGLDTRVGLEDGLTLPTGEIAPNNASLVSAALHILDPIRSAAETKSRSAASP